MCRIRLGHLRPARTPVDVTAGPTTRVPLAGNYEWRREEGSTNETGHPLHRGLHTRSGEDHQAEMYGLGSFQLPRARFS